MHRLTVSTKAKSEFVDITQKVQETIPQDYSGIALIYVPHTSAAITINEGADPAVQSDVIEYLKELVPWDNPDFDHQEGNSAAHIKSILVGNTQQVIVEQGAIQLGTWEKIFLCEFDGPRTRKVWVEVNTRV